MKCPRCNIEVAGDSKFCNECGARVQPVPTPFGKGPTTPRITGAETIFHEVERDFRLGGRYRVIREVGRGGMGIVYLAHDETLEIDVAVKLLPVMFAENPRAVSALKSEARLAMKLRHPGIVGLHNFVESDEGCFLVMEYVDGKSLDGILIEKGKLALEEAIVLARPVAEALDYAHSQGVLHRDIKPGNILVRSQESEVRSQEKDQGAKGNGRNQKDFSASSASSALNEQSVPIREIRGKESGLQAKLTDFGIAREMANTMTRLTGRQTSGTLLYMSPEQLMGDKLDARSDIYSFAATFYECLSGHPPFHEGDIPTQIMHKTPSPIDGLPEHVNNALRTALSKDKASRPKTCADLVSILFEPQRHRDAERTQREEKSKDKEAVLHPVAAPTPPPRPEPPSPKPAPARKSRAGIIAGSIIAFLVVASIVLAVALAGTKRPATPPPQPRETTLGPGTQPQGALAGFKAVEAEGRDAATGLWEEIVHEKTGIVLRLIPAGEFDMGSPNNEKDRDSDEGPVHHVKISKPFYMGKYEVTQKQWQAVMGNNPSNFKGSDNLPVECVNWNDIQGFLQKAGDGMRLPTEAEWEYGCRAKNKNPTRWSFGDDESKLGEYAWYGNNAVGKTHEVGTRKPNDFGLYDMHGNVWEWCSDWYRGKYYEECRNGAPDPQGPGSGAGRVLRGGSWYNLTWNTRSAIRNWVDPGNRSYYFGFRVVVPARAVP